MDSLYKVLGFWRRDSLLGQRLPLSGQGGSLTLSPAAVWCDLWAFEDGCASEDPARMEAAVSLYRGALLYQEYYEWTTEDAAYCEVRFAKLLDALAAHHAAAGNGVQAAYYRARRQGLYDGEA